jgi:hypothetical protein
VDLRKVRFLGARGIGVLACIQTLAMARNVRLAVVADHHPVLCPLFVTADSHSLAVFPTLRSARHSPGAGRGKPMNPHSYFAATY